MPEGRAMVALATGSGLSRSDLKVESLAMWSYQSIQTKFIPCSNTRGSRVKATTSGGLSATVSFDHGLRTEEAHWEAVKALLAKHNLNWGDKFAIGSSIDGRGYVFVPVRCGDNFAILEG